MPKTASIPPSGVFSTLTQKAKQTQYLSSIIPSSVISRPTTAGSPSSPKCMPAAFSTRLQWPTYGTSWVEKWRRGTLTSSFHSLGFITPTLSMTWQRLCVVTCDTGFSKNIISIYISCINFTVCHTIGSLIVWFYKVVIFSIYSDDERDSIKIQIGGFVDDIENVAAGVGYYSKCHKTIHPDEADSPGWIDY